MSSQPLVSIIIPTYNRAHLIGETLDSVLSQTYKNWECIIVDDGSSDNTDEVVGEYMKKDKRFKYYHRPDEHLPGGNGARNYGFKMSNGEYVNWFDDDDLMMRDFIENHVEIIQLKNAEISICDLDILNDTIENNWLTDNWKDLDYGSFCKGYIMYNFRLVTGSFLFKRKSYYQKLLFNEKLQRSQEYEFFCRVLLFYKPKIAKCKEVLFSYRRHEGNKINDAKQGNLDKLKSGLLAKEMVIGYVKETIGLNRKLKLYFANDALNYLQYDRENIFNDISKIISNIGISNPNTFIKNYKINSHKKIDIYDFWLYQFNFPNFIWRIKYLFFRLLNKFSKKINFACN